MAIYFYMNLRKYIYLYFCKKSITEAETLLVRPNLSHETAVKCEKLPEHLNFCTKFLAHWGKIHVLVRFKIDLKLTNVEIELSGTFYIKNTTSETKKKFMSFKAQFIDCNAFSKKLG